MRSAARNTSTRSSSAIEKSLQYAYFDERSLPEYARQRAKVVGARVGLKKPIQFGKYWLLDRVNVGGMAEVWKAKAFGVEGFERLLAIKRILPNIAEDEEFITMFIDEAKIAVQLNHANIAQIFDLGKVDDSYFIAMEYVQRQGSRAASTTACKQKPGDGMPNMPIAQACFIVMKACEGLDYAHSKRDAQGKRAGTSSTATSRRRTSSSRTRAR